MKKKKYIKPVSISLRIEVENLLVRQSTDEQQAKGMNFDPESFEIDWDTDWDSFGDGAGGSNEDNTNAFEEI